MNYMAINHAMEGLRFFFLYFILTQVRRESPMDLVRHANSVSMFVASSPFAGMALPRGESKELAGEFAQFFIVAALVVLAGPHRRCTRCMYTLKLLHKTEFGGTMYEA